MRGQEKDRSKGGAVGITPNEYIRFRGLSLAGRGLPGYMFLQNQFVFFDFSEPVALFLLDYAAIMGLFVWVGHYLSRLVRKSASLARRGK